MIHIAPADVRDWGQAMMGELDNVQGSWAEAMWALGSSSVLARHTLTSLLTPGRLPIPMERPFADQAASVGKATLLTAAGCTLAVLLRFAVPAFRQALQISTATWHWVFTMSPPDEEAALRDLVKRAEARRDSEALAYGAILIKDGAESARLADKAVAPDPNLVWALTIVAPHHARLPVIGEWLARLEQWDPQNAVFPIIRGENATFLHGREQYDLNPLLQDPARMDSMQQAFARTEFDDYSDRVQALESRVIARYGLHNADEVLLNAPTPVPFPDVRNYATYLSR